MDRQSAWRLSVLSACQAATRPAPTHRGRSPRVPSGSYHIGGASLEVPNGSRAKPLEHLVASWTIQSLPHFTQDVVGHRHALHRRSGLQSAMELGWHVSDLHHRLRHAITLLSSLYHVNSPQHQPPAEASPPQL